MSGVASVNLRQLAPGDPDLSVALDVMQTAFEGMEGRIDPPSSIHTMNVDTLSNTAAQSEVWVAGDPIIGTMILTPKAKILQVGKLAVRDQRAGIGRALLTFAEKRALEHSLGWLELQSRVELVEVHAVFKRLGFHEVARTTHPGFRRPTSITFRKHVG